MVVIFLLASYTTGLQWITPVEWITPRLQWSGVDQTLTPLHSIHRQVWPST
jgi:hypothetical protein